MRQVFVMVGLLLTIGVQAQVRSPAGSLTLPEARRIADENNPKLRTARGAIEAAAARARETRSLLWNNPEVSGEGGRRSARQPDMSTERSTEWSVAISQTLEIAGQQRYRREATADELTLAMANAEESAREVRAEVDRRFMQVIALRDTIATEQESLQLIEGAAGIAMKRVRAGEDTRLDGNLAQVEAARARNQLALLNEQLQQARVELAETLQWPAAALPEPTGELGGPDAAYTLEALLASAAARPLLRAREAREGAARNRLALERAARAPDVTVGMRVAREGAADNRDRIAALTLSVPLPLFRRNDGNIGQASADLVAAQAERQAAHRDTESTVRALWQKYGAVRARVQSLRDAVLPPLEENQRLSQRALQEGEINILQLILVNRQRLEARRDLIQAMADLEATRVALEHAAGWSPAP